MKISDKRKAAEILGREGVSQQIQAYINEYLESSSYKAAVRLAGQLHVMADSCTFDDYWDEKMGLGRQSAEGDLKAILRGKDNG